MNRRSTQFGVRENTASSRQHAPRFRMNARPLQSDSFPLAMQENDPALPPTFQGLPNGATGGRDKDHLLTVQDVANLLHVPVSWVYGRTRQRCTERIPGFRLGKYWRFNRQDVTAWLAAKRTTQYHHA